MEDVSGEPSSTWMQKGTITLWRRTTDAVKDGHSLWVAGRSQYPELEQAVIRATSHDASRVDYDNVERVFAWVRMSPEAFLRPLMQTLGRRMHRTHSWVVALKGLLLLHGVFSAKVPLLHTIGSLPFDLANFQDRLCRHGPSWGRTAFVRSYFAFLAEKSCHLAKSGGGDSGGPATSRSLAHLERSQGLLDLLLQIKPHIDAVDLFLIIEAMNYVVIEIFDVYSSICHGIARVLVGILNASRAEAISALRILKKAGCQGDHLAEYFNVCREMGILHAAELPAIEQIPACHIEDLEQLIYGASVQDGILSVMEESSTNEQDEKKEVGHETSTPDSATVITKDWVNFTDDLLIENGRDNPSEFNGTDNPSEFVVATDPFAASLDIPPHVY